MITRVTNKNDNRGKLIFLTRRGRSIQQNAVGVSGKLYLKALEGVKDSQLKAAMKVMTTMTLNLSKPEITK